MIVKPSVSFLLDDTDAQLVSDVENIITGLTGNTNYTTPTPPLMAVSGALAAFTAAITAANNNGGGTTLTLAKNSKREALVLIMRQLASYVQLNCKNDLNVLMSSGFPIQKPTRSPVGVLPAPASLTVTLGARTGELNASAAPVPGAAIYNWRVTAESAPTVVAQLAQTTAASTTLGNLTPGVRYHVEVNAVGAAGPSNWSDPASQMMV